MPQAYSIKRLSGSVLTLILAVSLTGCRKQNTDGILMADWIAMINEKAGIISYHQKEPYFLNIQPEDRCFDDVQAAVEWEILDPAAAFEPGELLNREWMAFTLMNLSGRSERTAGNYASDIGRAHFPDAVNNAIASGLMKTDRRGMFRPQETAEKEEAEAALETVIRHINRRQNREPEYELEAREELQVKDAGSNFPDSNSMTMHAAGIQPGDYIRCTDNGREEIYRAVSEENGEVRVEIPDIFEIAEEMHVSGSTAVSFEEAEIIGPDGTVIREPELQDTEHAKFSNMSVRPLLKQFDFKGYQVTLRVSSGSIAATASRKLEHGGTVTAEAALSGLNVDYDWNASEGSLDNAFFRAAFHSEESFAAEGMEDKYLQGDFSRVDASSFLSAISSFYQQQKDVIQAELTLCRIRLPLPQAPGLSVEVSLNLNLDASGKAGLSFSQDTVCGMEIRNGSMRLIRDFSHKEEAIVRSDFRFVSGVRAALNMMNMNLLDLQCEAGAEGQADAAVHLYDKDGRKSDAATEVDAYAADLMSDGNENVFVCADLSGSWLLNLMINSADTACGRLGFSAEVPLLNEKNAPLIKGLGGHYENWHPVKQCTYRDHEKAEKSKRLRVSSNIVIESYALSIPAGESRELKILALPAGYRLSDLVFASEDASVAVIENGVVRALNSGSTTVTAATRDGKFRTSCSIIVPQVKSE